MQDLIYPAAEIIGRPGEYRDFTARGSLCDVHNALARLDARPVTAELRAESVVEGVLITGRVRGHSRLECARCLRGLEDRVDVEVCELYALPGAQPAPEDSYAISGTDIHLEAMLRDAITLALPLNPLCNRDCKGLCAGCGADLNSEPCRCQHEDVDPRWAELALLRDRLES